MCGREICRDTVRTGIRPVTGDGVSSGSGNTPRSYYQVSADDWTNYWSGVFAGETFQNDSPTLELTNFGASLSTSYYGSVLGGDDRLYSFPWYGPSTICILDPSDNSIETTDYGVSIGGGEFINGVLGPNGKIYCVPWDATEMLIVDTINQTATRTSFGLNLSGSAKWASASMGPDGKAYFIPYVSSKVLIVDTATDTAVLTDFGLNLSDYGKYWGAQLGPDGKVYGIPAGANDFLVIDCVNGTAIRTDFGADFTNGDNSRGACLGPDGNLYIIPSAYTKIIKLDVFNGTIEQTKMGSLFGSEDPSRLSWVGGTLGPDGKIYSFPLRSSNGSPLKVLVIDTENQTATKTDFGVDLSNGSSFSWAFGNLGPNGKIYVPPFFIPKYMVLSTATTPVPSAETAKTPYLNKN